jgi:hypothetical protein
MLRPEAMGGQMTDIKLADAETARSEAIKLREAAFEQGQALRKGPRPAGGEPTPRRFFGIFQNCGKYYTEATTWYEAASDAYAAGNRDLGNLYYQRGNAAMAKGDDCMSFW